MNVQREVQTKILSQTQAPLLEVCNLTKVFGSGLLQRGQKVALENFSMSIPSSPSKIISIAGESGSGKTTLARLILGFLIPTQGEVRYRGKDLKMMDKKSWQIFRREVQAIFQDPYGVYNPFYPIDRVFEIVIQKFHLANNRQESLRITEEALVVVGLRPDEILGKYPHQLSGGQRQRIMLARAFLLKPKLIIADEPVSMIDASMRAIILKIMMDLKDNFGISFLYITHDLSTAFQISDDIIVLYEGWVTESGDAQIVIKGPKHPYVQLLVGSIPIPDPEQPWQGRVELPPEEELEMNTLRGCKFYRRCPYKMEICLKNPPPLYNIGADHLAACYLYK
ncbi:MAG: ABC transporter ATP-binding protein [Desulfobacteraceae bacterium]|nr:MAG: ABC transporter ATP-binding protein [Desulfobacteraceae bacterium]